MLAQRDLDEIAHDADRVETLVELSGTRPLNTHQRNILRRLVAHVRTLLADREALAVAEVEA